MGRRVARTTWRSVLGAGLLAATGLAGAGEPVRLTVTDGRVSARIEAAPVEDVAAAIRAAAGVDLELPASVRGKPVTLVVEGVPLEGFLRRLLERLDVGGYALIEEPGGRARRIVVVESARGGAMAAPEAVVSGPVAGPGPPAPPVARPPLPEARPGLPAPPQVQVDAAGLSFVLPGPYDHASLTVAGPAGPALRRRYAPDGGPTRFEAVDDRGQPLQDGAYGYELVVTPVLPASIRERMEAVRESPDDRTRLEAELKAEGWLPMEPVVRSGHFQVVGGRLVDGTATEERRRRP